MIRKRAVGGSDTTVHALETVRILNLRFAQCPVSTEVGDHYSRGKGR